MTTEEKAPRKPRARTAYDVAGKISAILIRAKQQRADGQASITRLMLELPAVEREKVGKLVLAGGLDLCGFELGAANDTEPDEDEEKLPDWANKPAPAGSRRIEVSR